MAPKLTYRYTALPRIWPGKQRPPGYVRARGPFKVTTWSPIERALERELRYLGAKDIVLAIDYRKPTDWNMTGSPRADVRAATPSVIVAFTRKDGVRLTFPCDTYNDWQTNIYAVVKSLEALRAVDRYGVTQGDQQYVGFKALPPAGGGTAMTEEQAAEILAEFSDLPAHVILAEASVANVAIKIAKSRAHPDADGEPGDFERVTDAAALIDRVHVKEG